MPWFKVDDKLHDHRKARRARKSAMGVWVLAGSWCMDNLTDGFVPESVLNRWGSRRDAAQLCEANLWTSAEVDGEKGWQFLNWSDFQPSKEEVEAERAATAERVRKWREARRRNGVTSTVTNAVTNGDVTPGVQLPRPDPTRPDPSIRGAAGKPAARATQLPDDFRPTQAHIDLAAEKGIDLRAEWPQFVDHHRSKGSTMKDWDAALRTWIRNAVKYGRSGPPTLAVVTDPSSLPPVQESWMRRRS